MKRLNIFELHRSINEKNNRKIECYEKVLEIVHKKVELAAENRQLRVVVNIPEYVYGYPIYNINLCLEFILKSLQANGFLVKYFFPKSLYISWDFDEIKESKKLKTVAAAPKTIAMDDKNVKLASSLQATGASLNRKATGKLELNMF